jgi:hypothetical protein
MRSSSSLAGVTSPGVLHDWLFSRSLMADVVIFSSSFAFA